MRATLLDFRSPKQITPAAYFPLLNNQGRRLSVGEDSVYTSFSKSPRFKTGIRENFFNVGPGAYNTDRGFERLAVRGGCVYKKLHGKRDQGGKAYFFIGQHMVLDPNWDFQRRKSVNMYTEVKISSRLREPIGKIKHPEFYQTMNNREKSPRIKRRNKSLKRRRD